MSSEKIDTKIMWFGSVVYWFYNHFLKHSHLQILLNLRELFMAGLAVHKFYPALFCSHGSMGVPVYRVVHVTTSNKPLYKSHWVRPFACSLPNDMKVHCQRTIRKRMEGILNNPSTCMGCKFNVDYNCRSEHVVGSWSLSVGVSRSRGVEPFFGLEVGGGGGC